MGQENYLIHTCKSRAWYVDEFLIPSMKEQGIENIYVYNDINCEGQIPSIWKSYELIRGKDTWHLQDDIVISKRFRELTEEHNDGIVCGFCNSYSTGNPGYVSIWNMWYSMPCIRIPDSIYGHFVSWLQEPKTQRKYQAFFSENKHDDVLFEFFLKEFYMSMRMWNISPNLVNHIDHLIGGSLLNKARDKELSYIMSKYWDEQDVLDDIEHKLKERREIA